MRYLILTLGCLLLFSAAALADNRDRPRCELCGMFWDISATRIEAAYKVNGKEGTHRFESMGCLYQSLGKNKLLSLQVLNWATADKKTPRMIDGRQAAYLYGTTRLKGSMVPYIAAFSSKDAALSAQKTLGGDYLSFDAMWRRLGSDIGKKE